MKKKKILRAIAAAITMKQHDLTAVCIEFGEHATRKIREEIDRLRFVYRELEELLD